MATKCDVYKIDAYEAGELIEATGNDESALDLAIDICRERARLYVVPASWLAYHNDDGTITVKRYRNLFTTR